MVEDTREKLREIAAIIDRNKSTKMAVEAISANILRWFAEDSKPKWGTKKARVQRCIAETPGISLSQIAEKCECSQIYAYTVRKSMRLTE